MNEAQRQRDLDDHIDRDIQFACGTGVGLIALRLFAGGMLLWIGGRSSLGVLATVQTSVEIVLVGLFTFGTYHRRMWGPIGQLALWAVTYFSGWYFRHGIIPPLGILGLIVWYGYYCGLRGVRDARAQRQASEPAALTPAS